MPLQRTKAPPAVHFTGVSPRSGPFRGGPFTASRDSCPGADAKFFAGSWLKILWPVHLTLDRWNGRGYVCPPESPQRETGRRGGGGGRTAAPSGAVSSHTVRCAGAQVTARQGRRDRNGRCKPGFHASDRSDSPKPRQRVRRRLRVRKQLPVGVGPDDRMPPGSGSRSGRNKRQPETVTVSRNTHLFPAYSHTLPSDRKAGPARRRRCTPHFRQASACQGFSRG